MDPVQVLNLDPYVIGFVKNNLATIGLALGLFKGLAMLTPGTTDDKIVTLLQNLFTTAQKGGKGAKVEQKTT